MTLASWRSLTAMVLMLMLGIGLGMFLMPSPHASVQAVIERPQAAATPVPGPAVSLTPELVAPEALEPPESEPYVGVIFARQLVDIAARSEGRREKRNAQHHHDRHLKKCNGGSHA